MKAITIATPEPEWQELARHAAARVLMFCAGVSSVEIITATGHDFNRRKIEACAAATGPTMFFDADLFFIGDADPSGVITPGLISAAHAYIPGCTTVKQWARTFNTDPILWVNSGLMIFDGDSCRPVFSSALELKGNEHEYGDEVFINKALANHGHPVRILSSAWNFFINAKQDAHGWNPGAIHAIHATGIKPGGKIEALQTFRHP